jgi:hypothetical protein
MTFIVRMSANETGDIVGTIEHVRSGRKERFAGVEAISGVIGSLILNAEARSGAVDPPP